MVSKQKVIFWNVDTQIDFMNKKGKLYIPGAKKIKLKLAKLTKFARKNHIQIVNTADWHKETSVEFSKKPDYIKTFPTHCIQDTIGAQFIKATKPKNAFWISWDEGIRKDISKEPHKSMFKSVEEIVLLKNTFDIFQANYIDEILDILEPKIVVIYGVALDFCVRLAIEGLLKRGVSIQIPIDATKGIMKYKLKEISKIKELFSDTSNIEFTTVKKVIKKWRSD